MGKYDPLRDYLAAQPGTVTEITLSFREVSQILGFPLPPSAYQHRAWWSNSSAGGQHPYAQAWLAVGWETRIPYFNSQRVTFERTHTLLRSQMERIAQPPQVDIAHQDPLVALPSLPRHGQPPAVDCEANIRTYLDGDDANSGRDPTGRYASFDYCFNYFQSFRTYPAELTSPGNLELSCLQLGFYLASWGMLRGRQAD